MTTSFLTMFLKKIEFSKLCNECGLTRGISTLQHNSIAIHILTFLTFFQGSQIWLWCWNKKSSGRNVGDILVDFFVRTHWSSIFCSHFTFTIGTSGCFAPVLHTIQMRIFKFLLRNRIGKPRFQNKTQQKEYLMQKRVGMYLSTPTHCRYYCECVTVHCNVQCTVRS